MPCPFERISVDMPIGADDANTRANSIGIWNIHCLRDEVSQDRASTALQRLKECSCQPLEFTTRLPVSRISVLAKHRSYHRATGIGLGCGNTTSAWLLADNEVPPMTVCHKVESTGLDCQAGRMMRRLCSISSVKISGQTGTDLAET